MTSRRRAASFCSLQSICSVVIFVTVLLSLYSVVRLYNEIPSFIAELNSNVDTTRHDSLRALRDSLTEMEQNLKRKEEAFSRRQTLIGTMIFYTIQLSYCTVLYLIGDARFLRRLQRPILRSVTKRQRICSIDYSSNERNWNANLLNFVYDNSKSRRHRRRRRYLHRRLQ